MKRDEVLNILVQRIHATSYLEIGIHNGLNFSKINCPIKLGVDPDPESKAQIKQTSDEFFATNKKTFDLVFIDGLHLAEQVLRDVANANNFLNENGMIVLHDCLPKKASEQSRVPRKNNKTWTGDVWKAWIALRNIDVRGFIINTDYGCGVIYGDKNRELGDIPVPDLGWKDFVTMKNDPSNPLGIIQVKDFKP